ncbi:MAG: DJ-1/PfpI family protein [Marinomonas sp.]|uniref:DJ-1/PfpI family protein n=1 Tax=unclassified Marinomonas TaxID=196814 RepID=UPI0007AF2A4D|nr:MULTISPECIES: DJ-1/PfpI family protein [unclassified Marinomonas]KZM40245.1 AraC family transcriptional regulator [Marinomonas sp. SBI22]KZM41662.1 AraC family transcriptional regulator [Marinomonas sp. SBI8L]
MHISILTFDGFNELDSFIAYGILNRIKKPNWRVSIAGSSPQITSMNGLLVDRQIDLIEASKTDVVLVGSGMKTRDVVLDQSIISQLSLNPSRQLIGAQCSGALVLAKLGLLNEVPACTDLTTKPWVQEAGVKVLNQAFYANQNTATAGGCLSSIYLAAWVIARLEGVEAMKSAIDYVAPVGEKEAYVELVMQQVMPFIERDSSYN